MSSKLVQFYLGQGTDAEGRTLQQVMNFNVHELEFIHDYIQWLFPLPEPSMFHAEAPLLTGDDIRAFHENAVLKTNLFRAFGKILGFYGLTLTEAEQVVRSAAWGERQQWLTKHNHNYWRITRILRSLKLLGLEEYALAFYEALGSVYREYEQLIGSRTWSYWTEAVKKGTSEESETAEIQEFRGALGKQVLT